MIAHHPSHHWPYRPVQLSLRHRKVLAHIRAAGPNGTRLDISLARTASFLRDHGYIRNRCIDFKSHWTYIPPNERNYGERG